MNINYQIMKLGDTRDYYPNYDLMIANARTEEEREYIKEVKKRGSTFAYNMVYVTRQKCGHYEIFQAPVNDIWPLEKNLEKAEEGIERYCTRCICNFKTRKGLL